MWIAAAALACAAAPLRTLDARGPVVAIVHMADAVAVAALLVLCVGLGNAALRHWGVSFPSCRDRIPFAAVLGAGFLATELLVTCAVLGVHKWVIGVTLVASAVGVGPDMAGLYAGLRRSSKGARGDAALGMTILTLGAVGVVLAVLAFLPPSDWDSLMYHILVPNRWLLDGRISTLDGNGHVAFVGLVHVLYLPLLAIGSLPAPAVLSAAFALLLGLEVISLSRRWFGTAVANCSGLLLWGTPTVLLVAATAKVDVSLTLFLLLAHDAVLTAGQGRSARQLDLAALLLGLALGVKYQAGAYAIALAPVVVTSAYAARPGFRQTSILLARFAVIVACTFAPWLVKNQLLYGAPFFPFFAGHRLGPWLASLVPSGASVILDPRVYQIQPMARTTFNLHDAFLNPVALGVGGETSFYFLSPLLLLTPLCMLVARRPGVIGLAVPSLGYVLAILVISPKTNLRYLVPAVAPLTIVCTVVLFAASERLASLLRRAIRVLVPLVGLVPTLGATYLWVVATHAVPAFLGVRSGEEYLVSHASPAVRSYARMAVKVNRLVQPTDTVLMVFESRGLYLKPPALEDTELTNWPSLAAVLGPDRCLEGSGITHVLARPAAARYYQQRGVPDEVLGLTAFEKFTNRCLTPLYADSGATLYAAHPTPRGGR